MIDPQTAAVLKPLIEVLDSVVSAKLNGGSPNASAKIAEAAAALIAGQQSPDIDDNTPQQNGA